MSDHGKPPIHRSVQWGGQKSSRLLPRRINRLTSPELSNVGLLLIHFDAKSTHLRVSGKAHVVEDETEFQHLPGAPRLIRVSVDYIYYN